MKKIIALILTLVAAVACAYDGDIVLNNGMVRLSFDGADGSILSFVDMGRCVELMDPALSDGKALWHLLDADGKTVEDTLGAVFCGRRESRREAVLTWTMRDGVSVSAKVRLGKGEALSYWSFHASGLEGKNVTTVIFPIISGLKDLPGEKLAASTWQGSLIDNPEGNYSWSNPGRLTMQLVALYGQDGTGLYFSSNDTQSQSKEYHLALNGTHRTYSMRYIFPEDSGRHSADAEYETVFGTFHGDWHDAAAIYRKWAVGQHWCKDSRFHNNLTADWARNTALWVWNRGLVDNVLPEAEDMQDYLGGLPVSVLWHWWHDSPYDDGFPEYIPPKGGAERFSTAVESARSRGINAIVYMNSFQWGRSTESYVREGADKFKAIDRNGRDYSHTYNIFTGHQLTPMCMATEFWRDKYASLADTVLNRYHVSGIYMDQACMTLRCYNPEHGHPLGGGNYWIEGLGNLVSDIRSRSENPALGGEGSGEDWMPYLDLFLTLEASRERYMGIGKTRTIPLYQAVYHDYAITFGSYASLVYPPYDDLWPDEYRPENRETLLPEDFNMQFRMEQARGFVWGTQPMIANYHSFLKESRPQELEYLRRLVRTRLNAYKYLGNGVCSGTPPINSPEQDIAVSRISIYAGRSGNAVTSGQIKTPVIFSEGWKASDGSYAIALTNISDEPQPLSLTVDPAAYGIRGRYYVSRIDSDGIHALDGPLRGPYTLDTSISACDAFLVEFCGGR